ncbi:MAG: GNAT family N-acetyltransferase [Spirochaetaceae bacterium]|nr:GNAT family N-acetyltransferase [Spirochaetaceae bacterium]
MDVTIETTDDPELIVELLREVHEEHRRRRPDWFKPFERAAALEGLRFLLSRDGSQLLVARLEGVCVGYALMCDLERAENPFRYASRSLMVDQMAVSDTHRRRGIGALLINRIRAEAARRGAQRIELHVYTDNDDARRFYQAHGFGRFQDVMESPPSTHPHD